MKIKFINDRESEKGFLIVLFSELKNITFKFMVHLFVMYLFFTRESCLQTFWITKLKLTHIDKKEMFSNRFSIHKGKKSQKM